MLNPGDRLPPERELAHQLNVSRASVREAMRLLDMKGLVVIRPGAGTFVTQDTVEAIVQAFSSILKDGSSAADVFEMRLILEPHVAALAATRASEGDIRRMGEILAGQEANIGAGGTGVDFDLEFHFTMAGATKNSALIALTQAVSDILGQSREHSLMSPERSRLSLRSHRRILEAIEKRETEEAEQAMYEHIDEVDKEVHDLSFERW